MSSARVKNAKKRARLLVVDDEESICMALKDTLSIHGYQVDTASSAENALKVLKKGAFDLMIIDIKLPGISGIELLSKSQKIDPEIMQLIITSHASIETAVEALRHGAEDYILKPFSMDDLKLSVERALEKQRLQRENRKLTEELRKKLVELEEAHAQLAGLHSTLSNLLEHMIQGVVAVDRDARVFVFNKESERLFGCEQKEVLGKLLTYSSLTAAKDFLLDFMHQVEEKGRIVEHEKELRIHDKALPLSVSGVLLKDKKGKPTGSFFVLRDLTETKKLMALEEIDRMKSEFVSQVSHELRTPLTSIKAYAETLLESVDAGDMDTQREFLRIINSESDRLTELIEDLLSLSRIESREVNVRKMRLKLKEEIERVLDVLKPRAQKNHVNITLKFKEDVPPIHADRDMMAQLFVNLIGNAIKYSPEGGDVTVSAGFVSSADDIKNVNSVNMRLNEDVVEVVVQDQGMGIPRDDLPYIFDKFYRARHDAVRQLSGTGLGLAITKQIVVDLHQGEIFAKSKLGQGSTFVVRLPVGEDS